MKNIDNWRIKRLILFLQRNLSALNSNTDLYSELWHLLFPNRECPKLPGFIMRNPLHPEKAFQIAGWLGIEGIEKEEAKTLLHAYTKGKQALIKQLLLHLK